ncbi:MAG: PliI family lysozyme inhibitor of I-type lysozyme [Gemmatimonadota bacterium]
MRHSLPRPPLAALIVALLGVACGAQGEPAAESADASPELEVQAAPEATQAPQEAAWFGFNSTDYWDSGITFHVTSPNEGSINEVTITPSGLEVDNSPVTVEIDGTVTGVEVGDLNNDGSPEIYVYATSAGSGSYGSLLAYATNNRKSMTPIYLPPVEENPEASPGYMGHDEFAVVESSLVQRFPIYLEGDTNAQPTGGTRQVQYRLEPGEAGWVLRPYEVIEY